jgi:hypothetical protein
MLPLSLAQSRDVEDGERAPPRRLCKLEEGLLLPSGLDARLEAFVRQHFTIFDLPQPLAEHLIHHGPPAARPFTPLAMRQYLKRKLADPKKRERRLAMGAWDAMHSAPFVLDLLALCVDDLKKGTYAELDELYLLPLAKGAQVRRWPLMTCLACKCSPQRRASPRQGTPRPTCLACKCSPQRRASPRPGTPRPSRRARALHRRLRRAAEAAAAPAAPVCLAAVRGASQSRRPVCEQVGLPMMTTDDH